MARWCSLFLPYAEGGDSAPVAALIERRLRDGLNAMGYDAYDPFALMPAKAYPQAVKLFIAPPTSGWVRVLASPDPESMMGLLGLGATMLPFPPLRLCLSLALDDSGGDGAALIEVVVNGERADPEAGLRAFLRTGITPSDLRRALYDDPPPAPLDAVKEDTEPNLLPNFSADDTAPASLLRDLIPQAMRDRTKSVSSKQANVLIARLSAQLLGKSGIGDQDSAARDLLSGGASLWTGTGARRLEALANYLALPATWRTPDYVPLRDAYQLQNRVRRNPAATLYPGDSEAVAAVPDALTYTPIFAGKLW